MWKLIILGFVFVFVSAHTKTLDGKKFVNTKVLLKLQNEADMQSSLMPQELNPEFVAVKDEPWKAVLPAGARMRREVDLPRPPVSFATQLQRYSRMTACAVLAIAAMVEIILYVLDSVP